METDNPSGQKHECTKCIRCQKKTDVRWFHVSREHHPAACEAVENDIGEELNGRVCICRACNAWARRQAKRPQVENDNPARKRRTSTCRHEDCEQPAHAAELCSQHYRQVYRSENEVRCHVCGKREESNEHFHRPLNSQALQAGTLTDANQTTLRQARLCNTCHGKEKGMKTSDAQLERLVKRKREEAEEKCVGDIIGHAKALTVAELAGKLLSNEAVLLTDLFDMLNNILEREGQERMTRSTCLLTHLQQELGSHLESICIKGVRRRGYLLVRSQGDLHHALYCALMDKRTDSSNDVQVNVLDTRSREEIKAEHENVVLQNLHAAILNQAHTWAKQAKSPQNFATMQLEEVIQATDPRLWNLVTKLTNTHEGHTTAPRSKHLPCLFLLAVLAHIVYPACNYLLHFVLSDYVDSESGSTELLQLLSCFGICSSRDTFQRVKTAVVLQRRDEGLQQDVMTGAFSVTSIDNIDCAAPGKRITPTNQTRGFKKKKHVAPKPLSEVLSREEVPANPQSSAAPVGLFSKSHMQALVSGRPRTITECQKNSQDESVRSDSAALATVDLMDIVNACPDSLEQYRIRLHRPPDANKATLSEAAVAINSEECEAVESTQDAIFNYMLEREQGPIADSPLFGLKDFLANKGMREGREKSTVTTLGIIPELADNLDALKTVLDSIHELYGIGTHQVWHSVVGDQKLFSAMHYLKRQYGRDLEWLRPYPGDWHTMKNFQTIITKVYFRAGLRELAAAAGYKGSNLSGLESCTNFKHTHVFLLEAFESVYRHASGLYLTAQHAEVVTFKGFLSFLQHRATCSPTKTLWLNLLQDLGTYVMFWLGLRSSNWHLRMATFKTMAQLFHAFDRQHYMELCAQHLADMWQLPPTVKQHLVNGAFTVSVRGFSYSVVSVVWASEDSIKAVEDLLESLTSGCRCKKGCVTGRCKCFKLNKRCSFACRCKNCSNITEEQVTKESSTHARQPNQLLYGGDDGDSNIEHPSSPEDSELSTTEASDTEEDA